jgi:hypothetical protein
MADRRPFTESQRRGQASPFEAELRVADCVDSAMKTVQAPRLGALRYRGPAEPNGLELRRAYDSVLLGR